MECLLPFVSASAVNLPNDADLNWEALMLILHDVESNHLQSDSLKQFKTDALFTGNIAKSPEVTLEWIIAVFELFKHHYQYQYLHIWPMYWTYTYLGRVFKTAEGRAYFEQDDGLWLHVLKQQSIQALQNLDRISMSNSVSEEVAEHCKETSYKIREFLHTHLPFS